MSSPCGALQSTWERLTNFGNNQTACDALANTQTEASNLVAASGAPGTPGYLADNPAPNPLTYDQAYAIAQGDQAAGTVPAVNCSSWSDLSNQTPFSANWFSCLQSVLKKYAEYLIIGLIVLAVLLAWAYGGFRR